MRPLIGYWQEEQPSGAIVGATVPRQEAGAIGAEHAVIVASLAAISAAYFYAAISRSVADSFWMDEVLAAFAARQSTLSGVWQVIWSGTDFSPPTLHFLLHGYIKALGAEHSRLVWRLPSILAVYGAACVTFLLLVKWRLSWAAAVLGFGAVLSLGLFTYAIQVRQYGLLALGLATALFVWSGMDEARSAKARACCLWLVLSACLSLHFYGIIQVATIGTAELAYAISRRRVRVAVWSALLLTLPVEAALYPLASHLAAFNHGDNLATGYYAKPTLIALLRAEIDPVSGGIFGLLLLLAAALTTGAALLCKRFDPRVRRSVSAEPAAGRSDAGFVMIALFLLPFVAFAFSFFVTKSFSARYVASAALLPAIAIPYVVDRLPWRRTVALTLVPLIVAALFLRAQAGYSVADVLAVLEKAKPPFPIVISEAGLYIELMEAAAPSTRSRFVYLTTPPGLFSSDPTNENEVVRLAALRSDYRVEEENAFVGAHENFYVLTRPTASNDTITPFLAKSGLLGPPLYAENNIQLFPSSAPTHAQHSGIMP